MGFLNHTLLLNVGLCDILTKVYAPLLSFSFGNLRNRINAYEKVLPASPPDCQQQLYEALQDLKQEHRTLFKQAMVTYFTVVFYIPILSWEVSLDFFIELRSHHLLVDVLMKSF